MKKIRIFDTTLRDGEQAPGNMMTIPQKINLLKKLDAAKVDYIEVGFPGSTESDFQAVKTACCLGLKSKIVAFARAKKEDIDIAFQAFGNCKNVQLQLLFVGSEIHLENKRFISEEEAFLEAARMINYARSLGIEDVSAGLEDALRGSLKFLEKMTRVCIENGASTIIYADTVGGAIPSEIYHLISHAKKWVNDKATISIHCHNDMGLAVANTLAAIHAGADCVQGTLCGIGERAGNAALEEILTVLLYKKNLYQCTSGVDLKKIYEACLNLSETLDLKIWKHKPIIGEHVFSTAAGIHAHGIANNPINYEYVSPELFGRERKILIGKSSGRSAIKNKLLEYNLLFNKDIINQL